MAKRYQHVTSGALVSVRDDKVLGSEWVPVVEKSESSDKPATRRKASN